MLLQNYLMIIGSVNKYPRPRFLLTDQGKNLLGQEVEELLTSYGIQHKYTTTYNPQSNGIIERMHSTMKQHLRCLGMSKWHTKLPAAAWYLRAGYHSSIDTTPGKMVFNRDMLLTYEQDIIKSKDNPRRMKDLEKENNIRIDHVYNIGDLVLLYNSRRKSKFGIIWFGPYEIVEIPNQANYLVIRREDDLLEKVNKRRIIPYFSPLEGQNVVNYTDDQAIFSDDESSSSTDDVSVNVAYNMLGHPETIGPLKPHGTDVMI